MPDTSIASLVQAQIFRSNYVNLAAFVLLYYDYALTLPAEVEYFWSSRSLSWASGLFYLNRYLAIFGHVPIMVQYFWHSGHGNVCLSLTSYHQYFAVVTQTLVGILLIMRTYALYDRSLRALAFICLCALGAIALAVYTVAAGHGPETEVLHPSASCVLPTTRANANRLATAWIGNLFFDVMIFSMTVYKSFRRSHGRDKTLLNVLLRDGAMYFGIMAIVGLANILTFHLSPEYERGFITTLANVISSTMISRLMLNLRDPSLHLRYYRRRLTSNSTGRPTTNYPILSTVLEFNTVSEPTTTMDLEPV